MTVVGAVAPLEECMNRAAAAAAAGPTQVLGLGSVAALQRVAQVDYQRHAKTDCYQQSILAAAVLFARSSFCCKIKGCSLEPSFGTSF